LRTLGTGAAATMAHPGVQMKKLKLVLVALAVVAVLGFAGYQPGAPTRPRSSGMRERTGRR